MYQVMPDLSDAEYAELKADIAERGVMVAIEYDDEGAILDGHHRVRICRELGLTEWPRVVRSGLTAEGKLIHAYSLNVRRRQLTASQRAAFAVEILPAFEAEAARRQLTGGVIPISEQGRAVDKAAEITGASTGYISTAKRLKQEDPEKFEQVRQGKASMSRDNKPGRVLSPKQKTIEKIKPLAAQGHTAEQIGAIIGVGARHVTQLATENDVVIPLAGTHQRINPNRVISETVNALGGLAIGLRAITGDIDKVDRSQVAEWCEALVEPTKIINWLFKQLRSMNNGDE